MSRPPCRLAAMGIVNALGATPEEVWEKVLRGEYPPGVREEVGEGREVYVGKVTTPLPELPTSLSRFDCRNNRLLLSAFRQIEGETSRWISEMGAHRIGVVVGSSTSGVASTEEALAHHSAEGAFPSSFHFMKHELGSLSSFLALYAGIAGPAYTVSTACSSSAKVFGAARDLLEMGMCDAVVVGGADSLCRLTLLGFSSLELLAAERSLPMSRSRDGIMIGEGACLFLMTREEGGVQLLGIGESSDAYHASAPEPEGRGAEAAMRAALQEAGVLPEEVSFLSLHGTGTALNDASEAKAISSLFTHELLCGSTKPLTGHTLGAAGAMSVGLLWMMVQQPVERLSPPPHVWDGTADPELERIKLARPAELLRVDGDRVVALSNAFAFGGSNCSLVVGTRVEHTTSMDEVTKPFPAVEDLIPHAGRMVLLDRVVSSGAERTVCELTVREGSLFCGSTGEVPNFVSLEYMAQGIAVHVGLEQGAHRRGAKIGYLLGTRSLDLQCPGFRVGERLLVTVQPVWRDAEMAVFDCTVSIAEGDGGEGRVVCSGALNVYQPIFERE